MLCTCAGYSKYSFYKSAAFIKLSTDVDDQLNKLLIDHNIQQIQNQKTQLQFPVSCLPGSLHNDELKNTVISYLESHENMRNAVWKWSTLW